MGEIQDGAWLAWALEEAWK